MVAGSGRPAASRGRPGGAGGGLHLGVALDRRELAPPGGIYLVGRIGEEVVAGGGLRTIGPGIGEVKRMYVVPAWRGRGIGRRLLGALERHAVQQLGLTVTRLDTGPAQPGAKCLYESAGYRSVGNYNANAYASFWGEKRLA